MSSPRESSKDQQQDDAAASFAHSLAVAPLVDTSDESLGLALQQSAQSSIPTSTAAPTSMSSEVTDAVRNHTTAIEQQQQHQLHQDFQQLQSQHLQQPERMAVAELLVSLAQNTRENEDATSQGQSPDPGAMDTSVATSTTAVTAPVAATSTAVPTAPTATRGDNQVFQQSPIYKHAVDYVGSVKKAYESNPRVYTEFLSALELYNGMSLPIDQLVRTVMTLFQDQPDLLLGFKEFLPEAQGFLNQLVPPMMYSDYKGNAIKAPATFSAPTQTPSLVSPSALHLLNSPAEPQQQQQQQQQQQDSSNISQILTNGHAAADFLSLVKQRSQVEPDMYQHLITLLRKFQKDQSYSDLYFYVSIILRYHPHLLQRFHKFLPEVASGVEVTEPRRISKAPPEELVVSPDFIEAKDFVQTVKYIAKSDMSMYDRFIFALEKYQGNGWTIDQVYSEVSLIFWNHPDALEDFKQFIMTVPDPGVQL
ncbi:hypothetical protein EMPS_07607 [Entomortierella parvispora]|uniref:Paired amphipathic helix protein Sin3a n=1 Tax=Entomortierella parvispora TaxID=205924 RepID=A0A9P3LYI3_9FUNG|nr:hypothetical protein EMPS_07607 [Entomortierella parvispora]